MSEQSDNQFRTRFIGWQCRVRQHAMRQYDGRPSPGMRPRVTAVDGHEISPAVIVILIEADAAGSAAQFRHIVKKTHDPEKRHGDGLRILSSAYYQTSRQFNGVMTALFVPDSKLAVRLVEAGQCVLEFDQFNQRYSLPSAVTILAEDDPAYQSTYWHNAMFNPSLPGAPCIVAFTPDWSLASE